ncbi:MAG: PQQ-binding-like beta-propeller repeat protein [Candidatus Brocadiae bacterium]|nr:PQQ-binding-like beta-propeller repeat protein [Candidatus Brocadiia bacterium]
MLIGLQVSVVSALTVVAEPPAASREAQEALRRIAIHKGICVVLGLPKLERTGFPTELAKGSELLIYFQSPSANEVTEVRRAADEAGLLGKRVFAARGQWRSIHLADNLAGAVWVAPSVAGAVDKTELVRVMRPEGEAILGEEEIVKPFPKGTDDWPYPYHGPDNNPQSADQIARAPYLTQFIAEPRFCPSPAVTVAAGGRVFKAFGHLAHKSNQNALLNTLLAVNAYNGTVLWKRSLREGFMILRNTIVATPQTLYLADDESCKLLDAATGKLEGEIIPPGDSGEGTVWKWMAVERGVLYALIGGKETKAPVLSSNTFGLGHWPRANWPGFDYRVPRTAWGQGRTFLAIDLRTRQVLWRHREQAFVDSRAVCMKSGRVYFLSPEKLLGCIKADTGKVVWKTSDAALLQAIGPRSPKQPRWTGLSPFPYVRCNEEFLFFSGPRMPRIVAVSTEGGKLLWQKEVPRRDGGSVHLVLRTDALYAVGHGGGNSSFSAEYPTGRVLTRFIGRRGCTAATGSVDSIFYRATGGTVRIDVATGHAEHIAPMRPPCYEGVTISGGLLYWGPWKCGCQLSLYGHICLTPAGTFNYRPGVDASRLERGRGDVTVVEDLDVEPGDWPSYQGNNNRTCTTKVVIPKQVSRRWTFQPPSAGTPTAPVAAGGVVLVGDDSGAVRALDAADGKVRWKAYTGGAIFFPPAIWNGRVYVGSADGRVHAFEAATGRPLWKFRAAPAERWIPVFGKLTSTWPVAGGVVVEKGVLYAAAGIAHYDGTHVYALDAITGKVKWYNDTSGALSAKVNNGISLQGSLFLHEGQLRFPGGNAHGTACYELRTGRCINGPNDRVGSSFRTAFYPYYPEHGQYVPLDHTLADGRSLSYAVDYSGAQHTTLALLTPLPPGSPKVGPDWRLQPRWKAQLKRQILWEHRSRHKFNSFIVAPRTLIATGQGDSDAAQTAFLAAININGGSHIWRHELPVPAVKAGTAVDHKARIFVSLKDGRVLCLAAR